MAGRKMFRNAIPACILLRKSFRNGVPSQKYPARARIQVSEVCRVYPKALLSKATLGRSHLGEALIIEQTSTATASSWDTEQQTIMKHET
jgi:hypothetical protein